MTLQKPLKITKSYYLSPGIVEALDKRAEASRRSASMELEIILEKALAKELAA